MTQKIGKVKLGVRPTVCAVLQDSFPSQTLEKLKRLGICLVELRLDQFRRATPAIAIHKIQALKESRFSVIATIRHKKEGGGKLISEANRLSLFKMALPFVDAVDVELESKICSAVLCEASKRHKTTIVSFHDFKKTPLPKQLLILLRKAKSLKADIFKIAAFAKTQKDVTTLLDFTMRHRQDGLITIAMGRLGAESRILFPLRGSLITYGYAGKKTAPGQFPAEQLVKALRFKNSKKV